ncbi:MAG: hypothetical protein AB7D43_03215 [Sulfurimonadaceae bacterium]
MAANQLMEDLQRRASAQLGGGYQTPVQQAPADNAKYTHSYSNTPAERNGQTYNGTHTMTFEAPKTASAQWGSLNDMKNHFRDQQQRYDPAVQEQRARSVGGNSLLQGVVNARNRAMNEVVYPTANIRNARALLGQMQDAQYKQGHLDELAAGRSQRQSQFISELAQKQQDMNLRAQQFDLTHDLNVQNAQYTRNAKNNTPKDALEYGKLFDATYAGNYDEDTVDYLRDNQGHYDRLKAEYIQNGGNFTPAQYDDGGWFGGERLNIGAGNQNATAQKQQTKQDQQQNEASEFQAWLEKRQGNTPNYDNKTTSLDHTVTGAKWWDDPKYRSNPTSP